jgi:hypothetical protein
MGDPVQAHYFQGPQLVRLNLASLLQPDKFDLREWLLAGHPNPQVAQRESREEPRDPPSAVPLDNSFEEAPPPGFSAAPKPRLTRSVMVGAVSQS